MIEIRTIQKKDYPEMARIWRDVLDIPVTDECLAETYAKMGFGTSSMGTPPTSNVHSE